MENLTHSLLGAALAELTLPTDASPEQRRLFFVAGVVAANLPDADLLYTRILPPPLGYLLHHRGHTHTLLGCAALAAVVWLVTAVAPSVRRLAGESPGRFWTMVGLALLSHILADSWNSYGVHPFWPLDNRWFYGDAIFILEPWFWVLLGAAAAMNTRGLVGRITLAAGVVVLPVAAAALGVITAGALAALSIGGVASAAMVFRRSPRERSAFALACVAVFVLVSFGLNRSARAATADSLRPEQRGEIVDVVLSPQPATPLCWTALSVERIASAGEYVLRRGQVSLFPRLSWLGCRSTAPVSGVATSAGASVVKWTETRHESLARLRERSRDDCWTRAWLQFGRAPVLLDDRIFDARYDGPEGGGFTEMRLRPLAEARVCPAGLTNWTTPRRDLLQEQ